MLRGFRVEFARSWRDQVLLGILAAAFLLLLASAIGFPENLSSVPEQALSAVSTALRFPLEVNIATMASIYGSFRYTIDHRDRFIGRQIMWQSRVPTLVPRMLATFVAGAIIGLWCSLIFYATLSIAAQRMIVDSAAIWHPLLLGGICSVWGLCVGSLVRAHLLALFLVPATLVLTIALAVWTPELASWSPLGAFVQAFGEGLPNAPTIDHPVLLSLGWMVAAIAVSLYSFSRRDIH